MKIKGLIAAGAVALLMLVAGQSHSDVNPITAKTDPSATAHWDTTFSVTSSTADSLTFGFLADYCRIDCMTTGIGFACRIMGVANTLRNVGGGAVSNPRAGISVVDSDLLTVPAVTSVYVSWEYDSGGAPIYKGVFIDGTGSGTLIVTASRGMR